jgi:two-component system, cell cycle sensor histidine kinase and response regulator CckA
MPMISTKYNSSHTPQSYWNQLIEQVLQKILSYLFFAVASLTFVLFFLNNPFSFYISLTGLVAICIAYVILHKGYTTIAANLFSTCILGISIYTVAQGYAYHDITMLLFPITLLSSSILLSKKMYYVLSGITIISLVWIGVDRYVPVAEATNMNDVDLADIVIVNTLIVISIMIIRYLTDSLVAASIKSQQNAQNYKEIFNAVADAIFVHDANTGAILDINDTTLNMFEIPEDKRSQLDLKDYCNTTAPYSLDNAMECIQLAREKGSLLFKWHAKKYTGESFWAEIHMKLCTIDGQKRILAAVRDIDEKIKAEDIQKQTEKLVSIGQLAGGIAHDFNNQLTGIIGFAQLLQKQCTEETQLENIALILNSAYRSANLTSKLLDFARKGKSENDFVNINTITQETVYLLERSIHKQIHIAVQYAPQDFFVQGDSTQLQNCILNICLNARDSITKSGTISIAVYNQSIHSTTIRLPIFNQTIVPGEYVVIQIQDDGSGIPEQDFQKIFDPFYTTKKIGEGTGMGLPAVFGAIQDHHGYITIESKTKQSNTSISSQAKESGSTFTMYLPIAKVAAPLQTQINEPVMVSPKTILMVDDEESIIKLGNKILHKAGHTIHSFVHPSQALQYFKQHHKTIDICILDMLMPEINGKELLEQIRTVHPNMPIIICSGYGIQHIKKELQTHQMPVLLSKPFTYESMLQAIAKALS